MRRIIQYLFMLVLPLTMACASTGAYQGSTDAYIEVDNQHHSPVVLYHHYAGGQRERIGRVLGKSEETLRVSKNLLVRTDYRVMVCPGNARSPLQQRDCDVTERNTGVVDTPRVVVFPFPYIFAELYG